MTLLIMNLYMKKMSCNFHEIKDLEFALKKYLHLLLVQVEMLDKKYGF